MNTINKSAQTLSLPKYSIHNTSESEEEIHGNVISIRRLKGSKFYKITGNLNQKITAEFFPTILEYLWNCLKIKIGGKWKLMVILLLKPNLVGSTCRS